MDGQIRRATASEPLHSGCCSLLSTGYVYTPSVHKKTNTIVIQDLLLRRQNTAGH